jgi:16S rRNA (cytosine1402-N4)-methyltransferase
MRFNPQVQKRTAADIINIAEKGELEHILAFYGEEQSAGQIAEEIVHARRVKPIVTTAELITVIARAVPEWYKRQKIHFATKTFQALRVAVNDEIENIKKGIQAAINVLKPGGRLVAISFQGLEDKTVREIFKKNVQAGTLKWVTKRTVRPTWAEIKENPRARSAKMKIGEKI